MRRSVALALALSVTALPAAAQSLSLRGLQIAPGGSGLTVSACTEASPFCDRAVADGIVGCTVTGATVLSSDQTVGLAADPAPLAAVAGERLMLALDCQGVAASYLIPAE